MTSYPITAPASGAFPLTTSFSNVSPRLATDANHTNDVDNYAWTGVDSAPVGARVATTGAETYTIVSGAVTVIAGTAIDAVPVGVFDVVLVKDAPAASGAGSAGSTQPGNGLYYVVSVSANITLARAATMSPASANPNPAGRVVFVRVGGTANGGNFFHVSTPNGDAAFVYGTTAVHWAKFSGSALSGGGSGLAQLNVLDYGADPTGVADSTAAFNAAIAELPTVGGTIYAPTGGGWVYAPIGHYKISSTLNFTKFQHLRGDGRYLTQLIYTGTGPCISAAGDDPPTGIATPCNFRGFSIDGASAGAGAIGLQIGNLFFSSANDIQIQFFNTTGAIGLYFKNFGSTAVMERTHFTDISLHENTNNVVFDGNSVPNTSFDYSVFEFTITAIQNQNGVTLRNAAALYGCRLELRGNFASTATSNTGWVLALDPGNAAGTSSIQNGFIDLVVECDTLSPNLGHRSLVLGSASLGGIYGCVGALIFGESTAVQFQGASITVGSFFAFSGNVQDQVLGIMVPGDSAAFHGGTQWNVFGSKTLALTAGPVFPQLGDVQEYLLPNGNVTISSFSGPYLRARKMELILHQPASGAAGTITWPTNVVWARGNSTLSTTHSAVDKARLTYMPSDDKWYAELFSGTSSVALPEMSSAPGAVTAVGQLYVASDGSLHYLSPGGTDTQVAMP